MSPLPISERIGSMDQIKQWMDGIPLRYEYTAGVAGQRFLQKIKEGKLEGAKCENCGETYLPLKMYCLKCFLEIRRFVEIEHHGRIAAVSTIYFDQACNKLEKPVHFAYVTFGDVKGGVLHRVISGRPKIGSKVVIVFKPQKERVGSMLDIEGFRISRSEIKPAHVNR
jgi:uncharacterized OB-fold protein